MNGMKGEQIEICMAFNDGNFFPRAHTCTLLFHQSAHHRVIIARKRERERKKDPITIHTCAMGMCAAAAHQSSSCSHAHPSLHQSASHAGCRQHSQSYSHLFSLLHHGIIPHPQNLSISLVKLKLKLQRGERRKNQGKSKRGMYTIYYIHQMSQLKLAYPVQFGCVLTMEMEERADQESRSWGALPFGGNEAWSEIYTTHLLDLGLQERGDEGEESDGDGRIEIWRRKLRSTKREERPEKEGKGAERRRRPRARQHSPQRRKGSLIYLSMPLWIRLWRRGSSMYISSYIS